MVLPIGGFMPIPLAMMIPFMATQSIVMGDAFGKAYQFGKRKISAMSNEEFNALKLSDLIADMQVEFKASIPSIKQSINDSTELQNHIIAEMLLILPRITQAGLKGAEEIIHTAGAPARETAQEVDTTIGRTTKTRPTTVKETPIAKETQRLKSIANIRNLTILMYKQLKKPIEAYRGGSGSAGKRIATQRAQKRIFDKRVVQSRDAALARHVARYQDKNSLELKDALNAR